MKRRSDADELRYFAQSIEENDIRSEDLADVMNWMLEELTEPPAVCRLAARDIARKHLHLPASAVSRIIRERADKLERVK